MNNLLKANILNIVSYINNFASFSCMNWIKFVENHEGSPFAPKIGRSIYSNASNSENHNTIMNWFRETESKLY
jgi:hypothetical protein